MLTSSLRYAFDDDIATGFLGTIAGELAPTGLAITLLSSAIVDDVIPARDVPMDAAIVYSCDPNMTAVDWLTRRNLPMVFVDQEPTKGVTSINVDDRGGARAAAQHLVDLGHTRVAVMTAALGGSPGFVTDPVARRRGVEVRLPRAAAGLPRRAHAPPASPPSCTGSSTATTPRATRWRSSCSAVPTGRPRCSASPT